MNKKGKNKHIHLLATALILLVTVLYSCANRVAPDGGPYDVDPPKFLHSTPDNKALNVKKKKITLTFDEYVQIKDVANKVIISPPQLQQPKIMAIGKNVIVELLDDLLPNTTYSLDFTDAIVDNNEGNPLENFSVAFSTGNEIDTMEISGYVLNMRNHEPMQGMLVGIHPESAGWTAFTDTTLQRMSRTGDRAQFVIRNIKAGKYRVYALKESDGNYKNDMATEGIAFIDSVVTTRSMVATRQDTLWVDSLTIDTIKAVPYTRYMPDDLLLMYFTPEQSRRFISKRERPDSMQLVLTFNALPEGEVKITPIDSLFQHSSDNLTAPVHDYDKSKGTLTTYFTDPKWKTNRKFEVAYNSIDSLGLPIIVRDTINPALPKKAISNEKDRKKKTDTIATPTTNPLTLKVEHRGTGGINDSIVIISSLPIDTATFNAIELYNANDTILQPVSIDSIKLLPQKVTEALIYARLRYDTSYELYVDSTAFRDIYDNRLKETVVDAFKTQPKEEFSQLKIEITGVEGPYIGELLNLQDQPIQVVSSKESSIIFTDIKPDKYGFRLVLDRNGNGKWDTGVYKDSIQPEQVYYLPKILEVMKNWKVTETFNPLQTPIRQQKPKKLIKNKPKAMERKDKNKEREEELKRRREGTSNQGQMGGMPGGLGNIGSGGLGNLGNLMQREDY